MPGAFERALRAKPWLLPFIYEIYSAGGRIEVGELKERLGVRSALLKTAVWSLARLGVVEKEGRVLRARPSRGEFEALKPARKGRVFCANLGGVWIVAVPKRSRVTVRQVPQQLVDRALEVVKRGEVKPLELAAELGVSYTVALATLRLIQAVKD